MLHNQPIRWQSLITTFIFLLLLSYFLSCVSPTVKKSPAIKIPETSVFECIRQHNRVNVLAMRPPWTKTDVSVQEGEKILIFASGEATIKTVRNMPPYNALQLKIGPFGTYITRIGDSIPIN